MSVPLVQVEWDGYRLESVKPDEILKIVPEPDAPRGRKGATLAASWANHKAAGALGLVTMDPDIIADPDDLETMRFYANSRPEIVYVAHHMLWPATTGLPVVVPAYGTWDAGEQGFGRSPGRPLGWFATGFTYLPGVLLDAVAGEIGGWCYPGVDMRLSQAAREQGIGITCLMSVRPKHLHWVLRGDEDFRGKP